MPFDPQVCGKLVGGNVAFLVGPTRGGGVGYNFLLGPRVCVGNRLGDSPALCLSGNEEIPLRDGGLVIDKELMR